MAVGQDSETLNQGAPDGRPAEKKRRKRTVRTVPESGVLRDRVLRGRGRKGVADRVRFDANDEKRAGRKGNLGKEEGV